jgi:hypothetical protein
VQTPFADEIIQRIRSDLCHHERHPAPPPSKFHRSKSMSSPSLSSPSRQ